MERFLASTLHRKGCRFALVIPQLSGIVMVIPFLKGNPRIYGRYQSTGNQKDHLRQSSTDIIRPHRVVLAHILDSVFLLPSHPHLPIHLISSVVPKHPNCNGKQFLTTFATAPIATSILVAKAVQAPILLYPCSCLSVAIRNIARSAHCSPSIHPSPIRLLCSKASLQ